MTYFINRKTEKISRPVSLSEIEVIELKKKSFENLIILCLAQN